MTKLLSDLNSSLTYVTTPQSPQLAGSMVNAATDNVSNWLANGWLECDGSAVSRTTYADLFANTGTKYGIGDGSTTFNLPDGPRRTVEVDLSFSSTPTGWSLIKAIGLAYQTALGEWRLSFNVTATATASTNLAATLHGVFSTTTWSISNAESIAIGGRAFFGSSNITITTTSSQVNFIVSGDVSLDSKPTDDFVLADSRFSTFDEALESIPLVKAYDDSATGTAVSIAPATASRLGTVQLSSAYGAGDGVWGFVKAPNGFLELNTGNGQGSTNTAIRRMTNVVTNDGDAWTYADSATLGGSITFLRDCIATAVYYDRSSTSFWVQSLSLNSVNLSTSATDIPVSERKTLDQNDANISKTQTLTLRFSAGDVLRMHGTAPDAGLTSIGRELFSLTENFNLD